MLILILLFWFSFSVYFFPADYYSYPCIKLNKEMRKKKRNLEREANYLSEMYENYFEYDLLSRHLIILSSLC